MIASPYHVFTLLVSSLHVETLYGMGPKCHTTYLGGGVGAGRLATAAAALSAGLGS